MNTAKGFNSYFITRSTHKIEHLTIKPPQRKSLWYKLSPWLLAGALVLVSGCMY